MRSNTAKLRERITYKMVWANILKDPEDVKQVIADASGPLFLVYYADVSIDCY